MKLSTDGMFYVNDVPVRVMPGTYEISTIYQGSKRTLLAVREGYNVYPPDVFLWDEVSTFTTEGGVITLSTEPIEEEPYTDDIDCTPTSCSVNNLLGSGRYPIRYSDGRALWIG